MELKEAYGLKGDLENIIVNLESKEDLFDKEQLFDLKNKKSELIREIEKETQKNRLLSVGIVGSVKAGKSSFLNACIFDGKSILPKAATSTTAALTKITYSEEPGATVHFYTKEDWLVVEEKAQEYMSRLDREYEKYKQEWEELSKGPQKKDSFGKVKRGVTKPLMSKFDYEKGYFKKSGLVSEDIASSYELYDMVKKNKTDLSFLGSASKMIKGTDQLGQYVAGDGMFTPIVSYVELRIKDENIEGMEIIDTPGLNDPILSRSKVTKDFLHDCDVVILLSPCSQFMDASTITLMSNALPSNNVSSIVVVGSKLDFGILNESNRDFGVAYMTSINKYEGQFQENIRQVQNSEFANQITSSMKEKKPQFVSSICFAISQKMENGELLDEEEAHVHKLLLERYDGVENTAQFFRDLSGMDDMKEIFANVRDNKEKTIQETSRNAVASLARGIMSIINEIHTKSLENSSKLQKNSLDELHDKYDQITEALDRSRRKLATLFTNAGLDSVKRADSIKNKISDLLGNFQNMKTEKKFHQETDTYKTGFLGLRKEIVRTTIEDNYADTAQVKTNVERYTAKASQVISDEFNYLFNADQLSYQIKEIVLEAFSKGDGDYNEDDILVPLSTVIKRMQIPTIEISTDCYIDEINSAFPTGSAKNDEIHRLRSVQLNVLSSIKNNLWMQLDKCKDAIKKLMETQSSSFADEIAKKINSDMKLLTAQIKDKEKYIVRYAEFKKEILRYKDIISKYQ